MSWTDDTRCLYCDGRLPLYRKITHGQFCSTAHRKAYWQEQERLAVERLHQTHHSLRAYRPAGAVEAILGPQEFAEPEAGPLQLGQPEPAVPPPASLGIVTALDSSLDVTRPWWMPLVNSDRVPTPGFQYLWSLPQPRWTLDGAIFDQPEPLEWNVSPLFQSVSAPICLRLEMTAAGWVHPLAGELRSRNSEPIPLGAISPANTLLIPLFHLSLDVQSQREELERLLEEAKQQVPLWEKFCTLPHIAIRDAARTHAHALLPATIVLRPRIPLGPGVVVAPVALAVAGLRKLPVDSAALVHGVWADSLRALEPVAELGAQALTLMTPALRPRLRLAGGSRYPVETQACEPAAAHLEPGGLSTTTGQLSLPEPGSLAAVVQSVPLDVPMSREIKLLPLACTAQPTPPSADMLARPSLVLPQPPATQPLLPVCRLEPLDSKPASDFLLAPASKRFLPAMPALPVHATDVKQVWQHTVGFWNHAPRDLKMLVFAIPLLLGLVFHPALPKVRVKAPATADGIRRTFERSLNARLVNVKQSMLERAAVALDEDFRSGLDDWATRGDLDASWSFDATGFVKPGPLALYRPSLGLTDYQLQFLGLIDKNALSWVVRAADFDNYYVVKLVVLKPGPLPTIGVTRYAVIDGKAQGRADTVVPINARNDMLYRVRLDVNGDDFVLVVQGQMADSWSEKRLKHGGIGFFSARGEESRLRWVQVTHQYDMLGRLCAYLAPYNIPTTNGSW
jgi:hypothetical protein